MKSFDIAVSNECNNVVFSLFTLLFSDYIPLKGIKKLP